MHAKCTLMSPTCPTNLGISLAYFTVDSPCKHADTAIQLLIIYLSPSWITSLDIDTVWLYGPYLLCNIESLKQVQTAICSSFMPQLLNNLSSSSMMVRPSQFKTPSLPRSYCITLELLTALIVRPTYDHPRQAPPRQLAHRLSNRPTLSGTVPLSDKLSHVPHYP